MMKSNPITLAQQGRSQSFPARLMKRLIGLSTPDEVVIDRYAATYLAGPRESGDSVLINAEIEKRYSA